MTSRAPRGTYAVVAERLRERIAEGELARGAILPSEIKLAEMYGIGRTSARKVLTELERDGLVYSVPGRGWVVGTVEDRATRPRPAEIAAELRTELQAGGHEAGSKFMTATEVANRFGATRYVAQRALAVLEDSGLLVAVHGKGHFIAPNP